MCNPNSTALAYRRQRAAALLKPQLESKTSTVRSTEGFSASLFLRKDVAPEYDAYNQGSEFQDVEATMPTSADDKPSEDMFTMPFNSTCYNFPGSLETPQKKKPKRRRKPQKPGKTAKLNDRHFVVHNYHDHANDDDQDVVEQPEAGRRRGGVSVSFPTKLHSVLDQVEADGLAHVVSWQPHGRCFVIHKPKEFTDHIMPHYFRQSKLTSFQRQLNLYGFNRVTRGADAGGYYHELFLRGKEFLCKRMTRTKVKGTKFKAASSPEHEPDFYTMPPVTAVTPPTSDCDSSDNGTAPSSYEYSTATAQESPYQQPSPPIGNPERYQYPRRDVFVQRAKLPEMSPLPYSNTVPNGALLMSVPSFEMQEFPRTTAVTPQFNGIMQDQGILDQAVDELFLSDGGIPPPEVNDSVLDFVNIWDPAAAAAFGPDGALENDTQLGNLLDKLLWDEI